MPVGRPNRRVFIAALGGAAAWPPAARAQQAAKQPTIGFLGGGTPSSQQWAIAFAQRLRELGWIEGRTVAIEYRWGEGRVERDRGKAGDVGHPDRLLGGRRPDRQPSGRFTGSTGR
jgi:hypothetical protein